MAKAMIDTNYGAGEEELTGATATTSARDHNGAGPRPHLDDREEQRAAEWGTQHTDPPGRVDEDEDRSNDGLDQEAQQDTAVSELTRDDGNEFVEEQDQQPAVATATEPPAPSISPTEVFSIRTVVRTRLQEDLRHGFEYMGDDECVRTIEGLLERTITRGQNQSGLLIASEGVGRRQTLLRALRGLRSRLGPFTHVYLHGTILQNELEAFKEILAQLSRDTNVKHPVLSYTTMYDYLRRLLRAKAAAGEAVVITLDGLEHFAHRAGAKQLLLYNLLDWLQSRDVCMAVLGVTADFCIMDALEKRVRSRFSKLQIIIPVRSFERTLTMFREVFTVGNVRWQRFPRLQPPSDEFIRAFDARVRELFDPEASVQHQRFQKTLADLWDKTRSPEYFVRLAIAVTVYFSQDQAILSPRHFQCALHLLEPEYQLATLQTISEIGLALLIGMSHLENEGHGVFTLEMVYRKWQDFLRRHDMLRQMPTRTEAQLELENLIDLKLVDDAGDPFRLSRVKFAPAHTIQPEYRAVHLNFEPKTLLVMIRNGSVRCSTAMTEWMLHGG